MLFPSHQEQGPRQVIQRHQSSSAVLAAIREKLALARTSKPQEILDAIVAALCEGRGYAWTGIYLAVENRGTWQAASGSAPMSIDVGEVKAEIAVPIKLGVRTLGLIVVDTGKAVGSAPGVARQERALLQRTAKLVAQYLTTDRAKQLLRKAREKARAYAAAVQPHKEPQSARPVVRRAAAGDRIPR
jgi:GAF domain-containing protein